MHRSRFGSPYEESRIAIDAAKAAVPPRRVVDVPCGHHPPEDINKAADLLQQEGHNVTVGDGSLSIKLAQS